MFLLHNLSSIKHHCRKEQKKKQQFLLIKHRIGTFHPIINIVKRKIFEHAF